MEANAADEQNGRTAKGFRGRVPHFIDNLVGKNNHGSLGGMVKQTILIAHDCVF